MNRKVASAVLVISVLGTSQTPANALFGLSKCEKVKKQLNAEEAIGFESWKKFDDYRRKLILARGFTYEEYSSMLRKLMTVLSSDKKLYQTMDKNTSCFSAKKNSDARDELLTAGELLKDYESDIRALSGWSPSEKGRSVPLDHFEYARTIYKYFVSWETGKIKTGR